VQRVFTDQFIAELSLVGIGLDALGGCYLAYDLLGGKRGPLRTIARATGYVVLFFIGYVLVLGLRYAIVAASGMGILLGIEFRIADINPSHGEQHRTVALFRNDLAINTVLDRCVRTPSAVIASGFGHHPFAAAQRAFRYEVLYCRSSGPSGF
jgi:hypothetical protein